MVLAQTCFDDYRSYNSNRSFKSKFISRIKKQNNKFKLIHRSSATFRFMEADLLLEIVDATRGFLVCILNSAFVPYC